MMLFRRFSRFKDEADIQNTLDTLGTHFTVFPIIDPQCEGGKYLLDKRAYDDFNVATDNEVEICYFDQTSKLNFNDYKGCIAEMLGDLNPDIRKELHRPGFVVFFPQFEKAIFWPIRIRGRAPTDSDVYSVLSGLWKILKSENYQKIGIGPFTRTVDEGLEILKKPQTLKKVATKLIMYLLPTGSDDDDKKTN